jgi:hypothetical protein
MSFQKMEEEREEKTLVDERRVERSGSGLERDGGETEVREERGGERKDDERMEARATLRLTIREAQLPWTAGRAATARMPRLPFFEPTHTNHRPLFY